MHKKVEYGVVDFLKITFSVQVIVFTVNEKTIQRKLDQDKKKDGNKKEITTFPKSNDSPRCHGKL